MKIRKHFYVRSELHGLHIDYDDGREEFFVPFPTRKVEFVVPVSEHFLFLIDCDVLDYTAVLYDLNSKAVLVRRPLKGRPVAAVLLDQDRLLVVCSRRFIVLSTDTLDEIENLNAQTLSDGGKYRVVNSDFAGQTGMQSLPGFAPWNHDVFKILQAPDGKLLVGLGEQLNEGVARINPNSWCLEEVHFPTKAQGRFTFEDDGFFWGPSRSIFLKSHFETVPHIPGADENTERFSLCVEIWRLTDRFTHIGTYEVGTFSGAQAKHRALRDGSRYRGTRRLGNNLAMLADLRTASEILTPLGQEERRCLVESYLVSSYQHPEEDKRWLRAVTDFQSSVRAAAWEPNEEAVWILFESGAGYRQADLVRLGLDGRRSARIRAQRFDFLIQGVNTSLVWTENGKIECCNHIGKVEIDPSILEARRSDEVIEISLDDDNYTSFSDGKRFKLYGRGKKLKLIQVGGYSEEDASSALRTAANYMQSEYARLIEGPSDWRILRLPFAQKRKKIDEAEFFDEIAKRDLIGVVPDIARLLEAYLERRDEEAISQDPPWYEPDDSVGALGHALKALVVLDRGQVGLWRRYLAGRDEHESFSTAIFGAVLEKYGWCDLEMLRLGVLIAIERIRSGERPATNIWNAHGLITQAEALLSPAEFKELLYSEVMLPENSDYDRGCMLDSLLEALAYESEFSRETRRQLIEPATKTPRRSKLSRLLTVIRDRFS